MRYTVLLVLAFIVAVVVALPPDADDVFLGRWDLTIAADPPYASWLELAREGGALKARMVGRGGSVFPVPDAAVKDGELTLKYETRGRTPFTSVYTARLKNGKLEGSLTQGSNAAVNWTGVRAPSWAKARKAGKPGKPVALFNGKDLSGWLPQDPKRPLGWVVKEGALDNQGRANNIYSEQKFSDFKLEVEFNVAAKSNSGIYLRGRHEIQVLDDFGQEPESHKNGALYGFLTPKVNASKKAGEWQMVEATLVANRVSIVLNGIKIIDGEEIPGITGGALDSHEAEPGPVMLQGDHGQVQFRKVVVTPLR